MSMSKQDFVALADAIRQHNEYENMPKFTEDHLNTLILFCRGQNHAFMSGRWLDYIAGECGPNGGAIKQPKPRRRVVCEHCGGLEKTHGASCYAETQSRG